MSDPYRNDEFAREWYLIADEIRDRSLAARACESVLDIVKPQAARALVDAYSAYRKALTADVEAAEAAEAALWVKGKLGGRDALMHGAQRRGRMPDPVHHLADDSNRLKAAKRPFGLPNTGDKPRTREADDSATDDASTDFLKLQA